MLELKRNIALIDDEKKKYPTNGIFVNQPTLPELDEFIPLLEEIWKSKKLTNFWKISPTARKRVSRIFGSKIYIFIC